MNKKDNGDMNLISLRDSSDKNLIPRIFIGADYERRLDEGIRRERFHELYPGFDEEEVAKLDYWELVAVMNRLDELKQRQKADELIQRITKK